MTAPRTLEIVGRPDGIERMGGADFDHAVFTHVVTSIGLDLDAATDADPQLATGLAQLRASCVEAKEALSEETHVSIPVLLPQRHTEVLLTRREFEAMIGPALEETVVALRRAVASAGVADDDVAAVLLVGGSSRIPLVGQLVGARLGRPIAVDARPKDAICSGRGAGGDGRGALAQLRPRHPSVPPGPPVAALPAAPARDAGRPGGCAAGGAGAGRRHGGPDQARSSPRPWRR